MSTLRLAPRAVNVERRGGNIYLRSAQKLAPYSRCVTEWLVRWSDKAPERTFLAERKGDGWRKLSYREAYGAVRRISQALLDLGLSAERPVAILSDNGVDHALLALGAMHVGIPVAPISPAYSLMSKDFGKLKYIFELLKPGLVCAAEPAKFAAALDAVGAKSASVADMLEVNPGSTQEREHASVKRETIAKILFTSGSTGMPKGVINTHGMLCANQQQLAQAWPFVEDRPPVVVDWLPWNHTFGGSHNFNLVLRNGGTMYIDAGKPVPGLVEPTVKNLAEISPTMYFNVPRGYDLLLPFLERDERLRQNFFRELDVLFYAAAALPQNLWDRIKALSGPTLAMLSARGSTETSPLATSVHVGALRVKLIAAADPLIQDAVITGHDRAEVGALVFPSPAAKGAADLRERLHAALEKLAQEGGSSTHPRRLLVMSEPPSIDANEITDKGYMNQRAVLERRAALVD